AAAFAAPALALIGALAVACFVKVFGAVFLGTARSEHARQAHESPKSMLGSMAVLALCCFFIGLAPMLLTPVLDRSVRNWSTTTQETQVTVDVVHDGGMAIDTIALQVLPPRLTTLAPLKWISGMGLLLVGALALGGLMYWSRLRRSSVENGPTWGCGFVAPTP